MVRGKAGEISTPTPLTRAEATDFATEMTRLVRVMPVHDKVGAFVKKIELYAVLPETKHGELNDYSEPYDITYNVDKLPELVAIYERDSDPYALEVLLEILDNALIFSRPIPKPMVQLVRHWIESSGPKHTRKSAQTIVSRNSSLVSIVLALRDRAGIAPTRNEATPHTESGCDIASNIWNKIAAERRDKKAENWPPATYEAAREAWRAYQRDCGGNK